MPIVNPSRLIGHPFGFGASPGDVNSIPDADQTGSNPRGASFETGFPPSTLTPSTSGGLPPDGADMNGIFHIVTEHVRFQNIGGQYKFNSALATIIGGYDKGTVLQADNGTISYVSAVDNNMINFNTTPSSIGVQWKQWAGGVIGDPVYTEGDKWELCPIGTCMPFIEKVVGESLSSFLAGHPNWKELSTVGTLNIGHTISATTVQGRAFGSSGNGIANYQPAGSDDATLIAHTHTANDVSHTHAYVDRYHCEQAGMTSATRRPGDLTMASTHVGIGCGNTDSDNNVFSYVNATTSPANLTISVTSAGSGNGVGANRQRTIYMPWIIKVS